MELPDNTHPAFEAAVKHAEKLLALPPDERKAKFIKGGWEEDRIPTPEEFAPHIIQWVIVENARRGLPARCRASNLPQQNSKTPTTNP